MEKKLKKKSHNLKQIPKPPKKFSVSPKTTHKNSSFEHPMEMVTDPFYILDVKNHSFLYANKAAQKIKALKKKTCHEHFFNRKNPCTPDEQLCPICRVLAAQKSVTLEYSIPDKKKNPVLYEVTGTPLFKGKKIIAVSEHWRGKIISKPASLSFPEHDFRDILDAVPMPIFYKNLEGAYTGCNEAFARTLGVAKEQVISAHSSDFLSKEQVQLLIKDDQEVIRRNQKQINQYSLYYRDKQTHEVAFYKAPLHDRNGKVNGIVGVMLDLTKSKEAENALREAEEKYRTLITNIPGAAFRFKWDKDWHLLYLSQGIEKITGYPAEDFIEGKKRRFLNAIYPDDRKKCIAIIEKAITAKENYEMEFRIIHKDGHKVWLNEKGNPVFDPEGRVLYVDGILLDISSRKKAEEELNLYKIHLEESIEKRTRQIKESEERFRLISEHIGEIFFILTYPELTITYISPASKTILEIDSLKLMQKNPASVLDLIQAEDRDKISDAFKKLSTDKGGLNEQLRMPVPGKGTCWIRLKAFPILEENGKIKKVVGTLVDITHYKTALEHQKSQQQQLIQADKLRSLGVLIAGVAHEINNPNNFILPNSKIIHKAWQDVMPILKKHYEEKGDFMVADMPFSENCEEMEKIIEGISKGSERIKKIVENLREYSRENPGSLKEAVYLDKVMESAFFLMNDLIKKSTNRFIFEKEDVLPSVLGNAQQIEQVIINLITNACQALTKQEEGITVKAVYRIETQKVEISVQDEGEGIPRENLNKIFDPFFTTKRGKGGSGLGLTISHQIVVSHNGEFRIDSSPGKGTTVSVMFPVLIPFQDKFGEEILNA